MAGGELVGGVDLRVTVDTQKGGVGATEKSGRSRSTGIAELGRHPLPAFQFTNLIGWGGVGKGAGPTRLCP